jgi:hypothetical protein
VPRTLNPMLTVHYGWIDPWRKRDARSDDCNKFSMLSLAGATTFYPRFASMNRRFLILVPTNESLA